MALDRKEAYLYLDGVHKAEVVTHFGSQQKVADALTAGGFPIGQRSISDWPDPIPMDRAVQLQYITNGALKLDLDLYRVQSRAA